MDRWIEEWCSYDYASGSFHTKKLCSRRFWTKVKFYWHKQQNRVLCHPLGDLAVMYTVHLWLVGKRVVASSHCCGAMSRYWLTTLGVRKLDSLGYHVVLFAWSYV